MDTSIMCHLINKALQFDHLVFIVQLVAKGSEQPSTYYWFCVMCKPRLKC